MFNGLTIQRPLLTKEDLGELVRSLCQWISHVFIVIPAKAGIQTSPLHFCRACRARLPPDVILNFASPAPPEQRRRDLTEGIGNPVQTSRAGGFRRGGAYLLLLVPNHPIVQTI